MNKITIIILQTIIFLSLCVLYFTAPTYIDKYYITSTLVLVSFSLIFRSLSPDGKMLSKNPFTISNFFLLALSITLFQIPIEYLLDNFDQLKFQEYFYNFSIVNKSILFTALCLVVFNIGQLSLNDEISSQKNRNLPIFAEKQISLTPFLVIIFILLIVHLATVDFRYYLGGYSSHPMEGLALIVHGYLMRFVVISIFIVVWNSKARNLLKKNNPDRSLLTVAKQFPLKLLLMVGFLFVLTFMSGDRGVIIRIILLFSFAYFIIAHTKINYINFILLLIAGGFIFSVSKLVGGYSGGGSYVDTFLEAQARFEQSERTQSISPYTIELASSIYSNNILFSLWNDGVSLNGVGLIVGTLMAFPGGVTIFSGITGLNGDAINSSRLSTLVAGQDYGVGTSIVGDSLINLGFFGALLSFFILGRIFRTVDLNLYANIPNFKWLLLGFIVIAEVIILPRASMFTLIGVFIFDYAVVTAIILLSNKRIIKRSRPKTI